MKSADRQPAAGNVMIHAKTMFLNNDQSTDFLVLSVEVARP